MDKSARDRLVFYSEKLREYLTDSITKNTDIPALLKKSMLYSFNAGGKRLRPALLLGTFSMFCDDGPDGAIPFAASIEMIHTYSLIHDDLPAMDDDDIRRGKPSSHRMFGEAAAILAGDALLNLAVENMLENINPVNPAPGIKAAAIIMKATGAGGMIGGQTLDIEGTADPASIERMYDMKTGALIKASVLAGAALAECGPEEAEALDSYSMHLGRAFQIKDDILDAEGPGSYGKNSGSDKRNNKTTYISLYGIEKSKEMLGKHIGAALEGLSLIKRETGFLKSIAEYAWSREE
ncbi:MAG: polyprenyl synthetase family protein [Clostridia bacterium]|nr:polyprenyl synthetase family protein [Clostridia bacterium]